MVRLALFLALMATPAAALTYGEACQMVIDARDIDDDSFMGTCVCAYEVIEAELGAAFAAGYAKWETGQAALADVLVDGMTEDGFFAALDGIGEDKWAACAPS